MIYHSSSAEDVLGYFKTDQNKGLPTGVADQILEEHGKNIISSGKKIALKEIIFSQLKNPVNIFLTICAVLSLIVNLTYERQNWYSPILIFTILIINVAVTILCKKRNADISDSLKDMNSPKVKVIRDSIIKTIDASLIVPGDILVLETGDFVAADARLISTYDFRCNESFVTGEEITAEKNASLIFEDITPKEQRANMVFSGSSVITGHALAIVTETGMNTEVGKTVTLLETYNSTDSNINEKLTVFGKTLSAVFSVLCFIVFIVCILINLNSGEKFAVTLIDSLINCVVLLVSVLPDGLPVMASAAVGYAINKLVKKGLIIKDMGVFDLLPQVSVICSDKTGTLTKDNMKTEQIFNGKEIIDADSAYNDTASVMILRLASLCTSQSKDDVDSPMYNDATELAIIEAYKNNSPSDQKDIYNQYPCLCKVPFDAEKKITLTVNMIDGVPYAIAKGAPDYLLSLCNSDFANEIVGNFAAKGMRVIAVAFRQLSEIPTHPDYSIVEDGMSFAGLIALSDAPQKESIYLVEECDRGGIRTIMITGDHPVTAKAVARRLGILKDGTEIITGDELAQIDDQQLKENIDKYTVFARLLPDQKLRIVKVLKEVGHTVSITGDSVNDAAALSYADVGIAMGNKGTDVARGAADIIMNNNRFASIIGAINVARGLFCSIRKAITYILSSNISEFLSILLCVIIYGKFPIAAAPLLLINLITDIFPVMSILSDGISEHKPMHTYCFEDKATFTSRSKITMLIQSLVITAVSVIAYGTGLAVNEGTASTLMFIALVFAQLFNMASTKFEDFFYKYKHFTDLVLSVIIGAMVLFTFLLAITPFGNSFSLTTISFGNFITVLLLSLLAFISGELIKFGFYLYNRFNKN